MPKCQNCQSELRQIPAGISKSTGKPYQSFMACPNKCQQPKGAIPPQQSSQPNETLTVLKEIRDILKQMSKCAETKTIEYNDAPAPTDSDFNIPF